MHFLVKITFFLFPMVVLAGEPSSKDCRALLDADLSHVFLSDRPNGEWPPRSLLNNMDEMRRFPLSLSLLVSQQNRVIYSISPADPFIDVIDDGKGALEPKLSYMRGWGTQSFMRTEDRWSRSESEAYRSRSHDLLILQYFPQNGKVYALLEHSHSPSPAIFRSGLDEVQRRMMDGKAPLYAVSAINMGRDGVVSFTLDRLSGPDDEWVTLYRLTGPLGTRYLTANTPINAALEQLDLSLLGGRLPMQLLTTTDLDTKQEIYISFNPGVRAKNVSALIGMEADRLWNTAPNSPIIDTAVVSMSHRQIVDLLQHIPTEIKSISDIAAPPLHLLQREGLKLDCAP